MADRQGAVPGMPMSRWFYVSWIMKQIGYSLFETRLGVCGIAWSEGTQKNATDVPAVVWLQLPEANAKLTEERAARKTGTGKRSKPPPQIAGVIGRVRKHLDGEAQDFRDVVVDLDGAGAFARRVYEAARKIPAGETMTYGGVAKALGEPGSARAVGQALGSNPIALIIPCHRVVAAGGKGGGFSAHGGLATKAKMLAIEKADGLVLGSQRAHPTRRD
jgi:O-6-methylguanine DNA methyltransferase